MIPITHIQLNICILVPAPLWHLYLHYFSEVVHKGHYFCANLEQISIIFGANLASQFKKKYWCFLGRI